MLEQVQGKILEGSCRTFEVHNAHALVEHRKHGPHKVTGIVHLLDLLPFGLTGFSRDGCGAALFGASSIIFDSSLHPFDLFVPLHLAFFDLLDEVFWLEDSSVRVHFHDVHVHELFLRNTFPSDDISHIYDAVISIVSIVVEEDVLRVVVGLVNHQQLGAVLLEVALLPARVVLRDDEGAVLLQSCELTGEGFDVVSYHFALVSLLNHVDLGDGFDSLCSSSDHDKFLHLVTRSVHRNLLGVVLDPEVLGIFRPVELDERSVVPSVEAGVLSAAEFVELVDYSIQVFAKTVERNRELLLLFAQVHNHTEEGWHQVVLALAKDALKHPAVIVALSDFFDLDRVIVLIILVDVGDLLFFVLHLEGSLFARNAELLSRALGQSQLLEQLLLGVLEFGARTAWFSETANFSHAGLSINRDQEVKPLWAILTYSTLGSLLPSSSLTDG